MRSFLLPLAAAAALAQTHPAMDEFRLITLDPGHFHAGLIQKEMYPGVSKTVHVYAPLGPDLTAHLNRISLFNRRAQQPTDWRMEVHAGPDYMQRMLREKPGNIVVFSGRNRGKIDAIKAAVDGGLNVLADKPWIIRPADMATLEASLDEADRKGLVAYDIMTERYEITSILQRELVQDEGVFGSMLPGTEAEPAVYMESVHYLMKQVAGVPLLRPAWFFDVEQQGEALSDVGTHLVDLVQWTLFPERAIDYRADIRLERARRWPTALSKAQFQRVTNEPDFPSYLKVKNDSLDYYCNTQVQYRLRGVHVKLDVLWHYEAEAGAGDTHFAVYRGSRSRVEIRQKKEQKFRPELYVVANNPGVKRALADRVEALQKQFPGVALQDLGAEFLVSIPDKYRVGHEAHFAQVANQFFDYLRAPKRLPAWEKPNMLAKYYVTTHGVELSHR